MRHLTLLTFPANLRQRGFVLCRVSPEQLNVRFGRNQGAGDGRRKITSGELKMKTRFAIMLLAVVTLASAPALRAQDHGEVAVFGEVFRASSTNLFGVGGRLGLNVHPNVALEAEGAYDFSQSNTQSVTDINNNTTLFRTDLRATHGLFGPKFQLGTNGPVRAFLFAKGGFVRFGVTPGPVTFGAFPTRLQNTDLNGAFYPGGGIEFFLGPIGLRADAGDEMYFDRGAQHNLKVTFGPSIRF
jgi:hypothetical protein